MVSHSHSYVRSTIFCCDDNATMNSRHHSKLAMYCLYMATDVVWGIGKIVGTSKRHVMVIIVPRLGTRSEYPRYNIASYYTSTTSSSVGGRKRI